MALIEPFAGGGLHGEVAAAHRPDDPVAELARLADPAAAAATVHWGRNYLYAAELHGRSGVVPVVVKQFRNQGWRGRLDRRLRGSKAARSWRVAWHLVRAGLATPEPVALVESDRPDGPSTYIARRVDGAEVRHFFRVLNREPDPEPFPDVEPIPFLERLGRLARRLHDAGIVYRDLSMGNILAVGPAPEPDLYLVDFNRARIGRRPGVWRRTRDICRLPVLEREHRMAFLRGYWGEVPARSSPRWWLYGLSVRAYLAKHAVKRRLEPLRHRRPGARPRGHHPHIPPARDGAGRRDRAVWDHLSDQPHQHAGRWAKRLIRIADAPDHLRELAEIARSVPAVAARYRELLAERGSVPVRFDGIGLGLRPWPEEPETHLAAIEGLGVRRLLLRLHPWQDDHEAEEALARELHRRGFDLVFALPQVRELVRDPVRWRAAVAELGARFAPYGRAFQIGQAVNRSKWGIWTPAEYVQFYRAASEELRRLGDVELLGPAVIDFELHVTASLANRRTDGLRFDVVTSLLYVDRRGAPERPQMGFDTVRKVLLLKAIADTGRNAAGRAWITEFNWPLREGPHSPAGRAVAVAEPCQADYLVRYYLLALGTGAVERVYWWQLLARGYGLVAPEPGGGLRRRPAWHALRTLVSELEGTTFTGSLAAPDGVRLYRFRRAHDELVVAWSLEPNRSADLPGEAVRAIGRDGEELAPPDGTRIRVGPSPVYYVLSSGERASGS